MFNFNLLPCPADDKYRGYNIALWFFIAFVCLMTWRSIIHMFFEQYGMHSIANFSVLWRTGPHATYLYVFLFMGFCSVDFLRGVLDRNL